MKACDAVVGAPAPTTPASGLSWLWSANLQQFYSTSRQVPEGWRMWSRNASRRSKYSSISDADIRCLPVLGALEHDSPWPLGSPLAVRVGASRPASLWIGSQQVRRRFNRRRLRSIRDDLWPGSMGSFAVRGRSSESVARRGCLCPRQKQPGHDSGRRAWRRGCVAGS